MCPQRKIMMEKPLPDHHDQRLGLDHPKKRLFRPFSLNLLVYSGLILAIWNGLRLVQGIISWTSLQTYTLSPGVWYICVSGGTWTVISLLISWGLWFEMEWAWLATFIGMAGYACWYWFDRLVFQYPHSNWPFALVATFSCIAILIILLLSPGVRQIFLKGSNDRKPKI